MLQMQTCLSVRGGRRASGGSFQKLDPLSIVSARILSVSFLLSHNPLLIHSSLYSTYYNKHCITIISEFSPNSIMKILLSPFPPNSRFCFFPDNSMLPFYHLILLLPLNQNSFFTLVIESKDRGANLNPFLLLFPSVQ